MKKKLKKFDKYEYYLKSVQSPDEDAAFLETVYTDAYQKKPNILREDFCAAHALSCAWIKRSDQFSAIGVDLDPEPIAYGAKNYVEKLTESQQNRLQILNQDVLDRNLPKADIIAALNFSYFIFKERQTLKDYLKNCHQSLNHQGVIVMDCFGGAGCLEPNEHETEYKDYSYYWDQDTYDPISNESMFYIHFKRKGEARREKVFTYDWRLWSIREIRDLLSEVGFSKSHIYWEGTDDDGDGNGVFSKTEVGEDCESWVAYIVGEK